MPKTKPPERPRCSCNCTCTHAALLRSLVSCCQLILVLLQSLSFFWTTFTPVGYGVLNWFCSGSGMYSTVTGGQKRGCTRVRPACVPKKKKPTTPKFNFLFLFFFLLRPGGGGVSPFAVNPIRAGMDVSERGRVFEKNNCRTKKRTSARPTIPFPHRHVYCTSCAGRQRHDTTQSHAATPCPNATAWCACARVSARPSIPIRICYYYCTVLILYFQS